ncbi:MAG: DUF4339 domain-containing protein [Bacteroidales bacterium]|nr:DUF4339 domain-containing protein [Candidatus Sodaliphilus aphodohippi]
MKFYIAENGQPAGPFEPQELLEHGLTVNSMVWNNTMDTWTRAADVAELSSILNRETESVPPPVNDDFWHEPQENGYAQPQYETPSTEQRIYGQPVGGKMYNFKDWHTEALIVTILSLLCCCNLISMILGIIAMSKASNARNAFAYGDKQVAEHYASTAKTLTIIAFVWLFVGSIISKAIMTYYPIDLTGLIGKLYNF